MIYDTTPMHDGIALTKHDHMVAFIKPLSTTARKPKPLTSDEIEYMTKLLAEALNAKVAAKIAAMPADRTTLVHTANGKFKLGDVVVCGNFEATGVIGYIDLSNAKRNGVNPRKCIRVDHGKISTWWAFDEVRPLPKLFSAPAIDQTALRETQDALLALLKSVEAGVFRYEQEMIDNVVAGYEVLKKYAPTPPAEDPKWRMAAEPKGWRTTPPWPSAGGRITHFTDAGSYKTWEGCCRDQAIAVSE